MDDSTSEYRIPVIEDGRLSWTNSPLRVMKSDPKARWTEWRNGCRGGGSRIAKLDVDLRFTVSETWIEQVEIGHRALVLLQSLCCAEKDGIGRRVDPLNIQALAGGDAEASALTGCIEGDAVVLT